MNRRTSAAGTGDTERDWASGHQEDLLLDHRDRFAFATEAAQIGYWFCDLPFDRLMWDDRVKEHFSLAPDVDVDIGLFYERLHPDDRERTRQAIDLAIGTHTRYDIEYRTVSPEGQIKWIRAIGRTDYDADGKPVRFDGVTRDISALKEAEEARDRAKEALIRSEKLALVGRLAATITHEINNPLAAVNELLYLIEHSEPDATTLRYVKLAREELDRASHIITHTLRFNRGSDLRSWERASHIVDSALTLFDSRLRQKMIILQREYAEDDSLFCFVSELRQVFANLIANAIDAMQSNGRLIVRSQSRSNVRTGEQGVCITIADTGQGMDGETMRKLFQPFVSTKGDQGTGLGLWVSREILDKHNALIRVRSRQSAGASGTVFSIWIPKMRAVYTDTPSKGDT